MSNHPHLTGIINGTKEEFSALFRLVNSLFAKTINQHFKRKGQVVMDRFKSPVIQTDKDLLHVMIYGDLNSFRAHMVDHPKEYRWSSYHFYAYGKKDPLITPAPSYLTLRGSPQECQKRYQELVKLILEKEGYVKRHYSSRLFIGDPDWVQKRSKELKEVLQTKREAYLKRQKKILYPRPQSPP